MARTDKLSVDLGHSLVIPHSGETITPAKVLGGSLNVVGAVLALNAVGDSCSFQGNIARLSRA